MAGTYDIVETWPNQGTPFTVPSNFVTDKLKSGSLNSPSAASSHGGLTSSSGKTSSFDTLLNQLQQIGQSASSSASGSSSSSSYPKTLTSNNRAEETLKRIINRYMTNSTDSADTANQTDLESLDEATRSEVRRVLERLKSMLDSEAQNPGSTEAQEYINWLMMGDNAESASNTEAWGDLAQTAEDLKKLDDLSASALVAQLMPILLQLTQNAAGTGAVNLTDVPPEEAGVISVGTASSYSSLSASDLAGRIQRLMDIMDGVVTTAELSQIPEPLPSFPDIPVTDGSTPVIPDGSISGEIIQPEVPEVPVTPEVPVVPVEPDISGDGEGGSSGEVSDGGDISLPDEIPPVEDNLQPDGPSAGESGGGEQGGAENWQTASLANDTALSSARGSLLRNAMNISDRSGEMNALLAAYGLQAQPAYSFDLSSVTGMLNSATTPQPLEQQMLSGILQQSHMTAEGGTSRMAMVLNPDNLGRIGIELVKQGGALTVTIAAESEVTLKVLQSKAADLLSALKDANVTTADVKIVMAESSSQAGLNLAGQNLAGQQYQQQQNNSGAFVSQDGNGYMQAQAAVPDEEDVLPTVINAGQTAPNALDGGAKLWQTV